MAGNPFDEPCHCICRARPKRPCLYPDTNPGLDGGNFQAPKIQSSIKQTKTQLEGSNANFMGVLTDNPLLLQHIFSYVNVFWIYFHHSIIFWTNYFPLWHFHIIFSLIFPKRWGFQPSQLGFWVSNSRSRPISDYSVGSGSARRNSARKSSFAQ